MTTALNAISEDLDWRESEIANMRRLLQSSAVSDGQRKVLLRAAWAMLYAHYEGFCKQALTIYYGAIADTKVTCASLPLATRLHALSQQMKEMRKMNDDDLLDALEKFEDRHLTSAPRFPDINTKSNLWPSTLIELLKSADLSPQKVRQNSAKLRTLVSRRNGIAHGENNFISEISYYLSYEEAVYDVIYDIALQIDQRLRRPPYGAE